MSLLLDALKKAALEKERREGGGSSSEDGGASERPEDLQQASNEDPADLQIEQGVSAENKASKISPVDEISAEIIDDIPSLINDSPDGDHANDAEIEQSTEASLADNSDSQTELSDDFSDLTLDVDFDGLEENSDQAENTLPTDIGDGNDFGEVVSLDDYSSETFEVDKPVNDEESTVSAMGEPLELDDIDTEPEKAKETSLDGKVDSDADVATLAVEKSLDVEPATSEVEVKPAREPMLEAAVATENNSSDKDSPVKPDTEKGKPEQPEGKESSDDKKQGNQITNNYIGGDRSKPSGYQRISDKEAKVSFFQLLGRSQKAIAIDKKKKLIQFISFSVCVLIGVMTYAYFVVFHSNGSSTLVAQDLPPATGYYEEPEEIDIASQIAEASGGAAQKNTTGVQQIVENAEATGEPTAANKTSLKESEDSAAVNSEVPAGEAPVADMESSANIDSSANGQPSANVQPSANNGASVGEARSNSHNTDKSVAIAPEETEFVPIDSDLKQTAKASPSSAIGSALSGSTHTTPSQNLPSSKKTKEQLQAEEEMLDTLAKEREDERLAEKNRELNFLVNKGYDAFNRGSLPSARKFYRQALEIDENDKDALLGAAAVAVTEQRFKYALVLYKKRLAQAPSDQHARAGLLALLTNKSAGPEIQSDIELLAQEFPEQSYIHFVKGNYYASQEQWLAANAAYISAFDLDNNNANYAYNLAISFEYLSQFSRAKEFYIRALALSRNNSTAFDVRMLRSRIEYLQGK